MFRPMRRNKQQLSNEECVQILKNEPRGVMAVNGEDGYPYSFPMNHIYIDGKLYFHSAKVGHKTDALKQDNRVSFCVMDKGYKKDGEWSLNINSVIIFGKIKIVQDETECADYVRKLAVKYYPSKDDIERIIKSSMGHFDIWELSTDHMTGKLVNES